MSTKSRLLAVIGVGALAVTSTFGCVADRPARNGVFNENQYIRKAFLIRPEDTNPDSGWIFEASITEASSPNVFGDSDVFGLYAGSHTNGEIVHFVVTSDKLQMVSNREISADPSIDQQGSVENAWPVTNVDLKYQVNLDGEKTNFYSENQELDWQVRQWVKLQFDKNDMSDLIPFGQYYVNNIQYCSDPPNFSATLVPNSFLVDETNNYMEWSIQVTVPILGAATSQQVITDCTEAFGNQFNGSVTAFGNPGNGTTAAQLGRSSETVTLRYSLTRANPKPSYQPLVVAEKDPIQKKYGPILFNSIARDPSTGLLGSNQYVVRYDPTKQIDWYIEGGFPAQYLPIFTSNPKVLGATPPLQGVATIEDATNQLLTDSGAAARVVFHLANEPLADGTKVVRSYGDVRYNMLRWSESLDQTSSFVGSTGWVIDPRTGENLKTDIVFANTVVKDYYIARIDSYLQSIGASAGAPFDQTAWPAQPLDASGNPIACAAPGDVGKTAPIIPNTLIFNHNGNSTLFQKIQGYLYKPASQYGPLGPQDFILSHADAMGNPDTDFYNAYYAYLPYIVFADPATNPYVTPESGAANTPGGQSAAIWKMIDQEAQLHQIESQLDQGQAPFDVNGTTGEQNAVAFMDNYKALTLNHHALQYAMMELPAMKGLGIPMAAADTPDAFAMVSVIQKDARHCIQDATGIHWESKTDWVNGLIFNYWSQVFWHEFGHAMGLDHNFMASVDAPNFPAPTGPNTTNADGTTRYPLYSSSVMEYNAPADRFSWNAGWAPYDQGAISWIYANANGNPANVPQMPSGSATAKGVSGEIYTVGPSGQISSYPWIDPHGAYKTGDPCSPLLPAGSCTAGNERQYLFCDARHLKETPLCRQGDVGTTPSEITANEIDEYEWQYQWRNFRQYRKFWNDASYGDQPMNTITEQRRFLSLWAYDMSSSELTQRFLQIGVNPPTGAVSSQFYYDQLTRKFADEMAHSGELSAAFHEAIVQQSAGARPYVTVFDNYFGDVTQQGIFLDKLDAIQSFTALWPVDNYDQTQAAGQFITSYAAFGTTFYTDQAAIGSTYQTAAEQAVQSMLGGTFDAFYYAKPLAVAQFSFDTFDPNYLGANAAPARSEAREWAGGYMFSRLEDFLAFFQNIAMQSNFSVTSASGQTIDCTGTSLASCNYDPRTPRAYPADTFFSDGYNRFLGPDARRYIWAYLQDRNQWIVADQDRNVATYVTMYNYTTDVIFEKDDGNISALPPGAAALELQLKYMFDYYYEAQTLSPTP